MADTYLNSAQSIVNGNNELYNQYFNSANAFSSSEAEKNRQWQEYMSNTSYQRAVKDLESAGLNPILAVSNGGASTPSGSTAHSVSGNVDTSLMASLLPTLVNSATQLETAQINQETQLESARINATSAQSVAQTNKEASKYTADSNRASSKYSAETSASASKYSAESSKEAQKYSADTSQQNTLYSNIQSEKNAQKSYEASRFSAIMNAVGSLVGSASRLIK